MPLQHSVSKRVGLIPRTPHVEYLIQTQSATPSHNFITTMKNTKSPRSGFTLIELLTVIAIIGILAAILIPAVGKVREVANKSTSASDMRSIALAYATYSQAGGRTRVLNENRLAAKSYPKTVQGVAQFLGDETDLNDASIWRIGVDPDVIATEPNPPTVGFRAADGTYTPDTEFTSSSVSYDFIIGVGGNDPTTTTPLLFTRGLSTDGQWDNSTPWGRGGHIAFLDAHVTFYNELDDTELGLVNRDTGKLTKNYEDAIRDTAEALEAKQ